MHAQQAAATLGWSSAKLEVEVKAVQDRFAGLITREGAVEIVLRQNGVQPQKQVVKTNYEKLSDCLSLPDGSQASFAARAWSVFSPRTFVRVIEGKGERRGKVCNIEVADGTGNARLVLWNRDVDLVEKGVIERNDVVLVRNSLVKKNAFTEFHSGLSTRINVVKKNDAAEYEKLPANPLSPTKLSSLQAGTQADVFCRLMSVGKPTEFSRERNGKKELGLRCEATVSDGETTMRVVGWDENAKTLSSCKVGEALKIEGAQVKERGGVELQCNWQTRIIRNAKNHSLKERAEILKSAYQKIVLSEALENVVAVVTAKMVELKSANLFYKCSSCGNRLQEGQCSCGGKEKNALLVLRATIDDGTANIACVFFDAEALEALEVSELTLDAQSVLDIKRDYLLGKELVLLLRFQKNKFGELEAVCKQIVSNKIDFEEEKKFLEGKLKRDA